MAWTTRTQIIFAGVLCVGVVAILASICGRRVAIVGFFLLKKYELPGEALSLVIDDVSTQDRIEVTTIRDIRLDRIRSGRVMKGSSVSQSVIQAMIPRNIEFLGPGTIDFEDGIKIHSQNGLTVLLCAAGESRAMVLRYEGNLLGPWFETVCFNVKERGDIDVYQIIKTLEK
jgi:hypothetical protein